MSLACIPATINKCARLVCGLRWRHLGLVYDSQPVTCLAHSWAEGSCHQASKERQPSVKPLSLAAQLPGDFNLILNLWKIIFARLPLNDRGN